MGTPITPVEDDVDVCLLDELPIIGHRHQLQRLVTLPVIYFREQSGVTRDQTVLCA